MIARSSKRTSNHFLSRLQNRQGGIFVIVAGSLLVLVTAVGLALDAGNAYVSRIRLSRAVDAGALAAARSLRQGQTISRLEAEAVARANGIAIGIGDISTEVEFGFNDRGENTVSFAATRTVPTVFLRAVGIDRIPISAIAEAVAPPLDVILVLDTSGSLIQAGAWNSLRSAAIEFTQLLDEYVDQMGLVSFQLAAANRLSLRHGFKPQMTTRINQLTSEGDTNIQEGLRVAREEMAANGRDAAAKVIVFFADGRATAMRGRFQNTDRMGAVGFTQQGNPLLRGYFNNPGSLPATGVFYPGTGGNPPGNWPGGCRNSGSSCGGLPSPQTFLNNAGAAGLDQANLIRMDGVLIYSIGLGNPAQSNPVLVPDQGYLREIANEGGVVDPAQPQGKMYFAPTAAELKTVFREVAHDLAVRLAK